VGVMRRLTRIAVPVAVTAGLLVPFPLASASAAPLVPPAGTGGWTVVPSPGPPRWESLAGVAATSASDVWAVGTNAAVALSNGITKPLAEHWNGKKWRVVAVPDGTYTGANELFAVTAPAPDDVWAVGRSIDTSAPSEPQAALAERWNGTSWSVATLPAVSGDPELYDVAADSPDDIWAVGVHETNTPEPPYYVTLAEHYNGSFWTEVPTQNPGQQDDILAAVAVAGPSDAWAVGHQVAPGYAEATLAEHWNGRNWRAVPTPNVAGASFISLESVAIISPDDVWAAGSYDTSKVSGVMFEHWNGQEWSLVASPAVGGYTLTGLAVINPRQVWGVGGYTATLSEEWNGTTWTTVPTPDPGTMDNQLSAVTAIPGTDRLVAVGYQESTGPSRTLILTRDAHRGSG
jgi:hypothetical protein